MRTDPVLPTPRGRTLCSPPLACSRWDPAGASGALDGAAPVDAERGEEVIITRRGGVTAFRLVPVAPSARRGLVGALAGQVVFSPDHDTADAEITTAFDRHLDG